MFWIFFKNPAQRITTNWNRVRQILLTSLKCFPNSMKWICSCKVMRLHQSKPIWPLSIPLKMTALQQEPWTPRIPSVSLFVWLGKENRSEGQWHCRVLCSFSGTLQAYVSQIQRPIFSWNPWLGDPSVYWTQHRGANPSRRGTCNFAKWRGSETKVQNLLGSLLDANRHPKTLPNIVKSHEVVFHCFSDSLPGWIGIQRCVQAPH